MLPVKTRVTTLPEIQDTCVNAVFFCKIHAEKASNLLNRSTTMKSSIRDKAEGNFHEAKGKAKEVAGKLSDNPKLRAGGTVEKIAGKVQEKVGQIKQVLGK